MGAMVVDSGLVLFQSECKEKENEITVLRSMLDNMTVKGAVILVPLQNAGLSI